MGEEHRRRGRWAEGRSIGGEEGRRVGLGVGSRGCSRGRTF